MTNLSLSLTNSWSYTIIWVLFVIPSCVLSVDEGYKHCSPWFDCGNQTLFYPFWTADREECGHPDFRVNCSGDFPEFNISTDKFRILEMNHESRIIRLASRMVYLDNLCPYPEDAIINQDVLPFYNDTELLTFFYDCPLLPTASLGDIKIIQCSADTLERSYFVRKELSSSNELVGALRKTCTITIRE